MYIYVKLLNFESNYKMNKLFFLILITLASCSKQDVPQEILIKAGNHSGNNIQYRDGKNIEWRYQFDLSRAKHQFEPGDESQGNLNKLTGVKNNFFAPMTNSVMVSFRYVPEKDYFELWYYWHDVNYYGEMTPIDIPHVKAKRAFIGTTSGNVDVSFISSGTLLIVECNGIEVTFTMNCEQLFLINTWFGGQKPTPNDITITQFKIK